MAKAERYLLSGEVPVIYPGTLAWLQQAIQDAVRASKDGSRYSLEAVYAEGRRLVNVYEGGRVTWTPSQDDLSVT